jgi:hypothetical protein
MRILACLAVVLLCAEAYAGCPNGQCQLNRPVVGAAHEAVKVTRDVAVGTVQVARNVTVGTVRAVTPPYRGRCVNGRCRVR